MEEALRAARDALADVVGRGVMSEPMGRGAYGDLSYRGDLVCEKAIVETLRERLGSVAVVSEEMGTSRIDSEGPEFWALIDPVDGSANMSRGIAFYSSGIALFKGPRIQDIVCSGVIDHVTGELFLREMEYTSHSSNTLPDSPPRERGRPSVFFHHASLKKSSETRGASLRLARRLRFFRIMGSALLEMCLASVGRLDGYFCLTPELRVMDIVPALYFALGVGSMAATYPGPIFEDALDSRTRYGVIVGRNRVLIEDVLSMLNPGWSVLG